MPLQNFVANSLPTIKAAWLNGVDVLYFTVFNSAATVGQALTALGFSAFGISITQAADAAAGRTALGASAVGSNVFVAADAAAARAAISAAASGANTDITSLNGANVGYVPVRQTVMSGPVDTDGQSAFGGSTGSTTVTATGTLRITAANGFVAGGAQNRVGTIVNPSWTSLSTNGTMYLFVDVNSDGTCTTGSGTLAPTERPGGADVVTNNQFTFNYNEMVGKVGNGTTAVQTYRTYVGQVTVSGGVVTAIVWYALNRRFTGPWVATLPAAQALTTGTHNLGTQEYIAQFEAECTTANVGYAVGDRVDLLVAGLGGTNVYPIGIRKGSLTLSIQTAGGSSTPFLIPDGTTGNGTALTNASWKYRFVCLPKF